MGSILQLSCRYCGLSITATPWCPISLTTSEKAKATEMICVQEMSELEKIRFKKSRNDMELSLMYQR
jgi:hypothetical protein